MKCKKDGCEKETSDSKWYCSRECSPYGTLAIEETYLNRKYRRRKPKPECGVDKRSTPLISSGHDQLAQTRKN